MEKPLPDKRVILVVILIISISFLAYIILFGEYPPEDFTNTMVSTKRLDLIADSLNIYYAVYNIYPPDSIQGMHGSESLVHALSSEGGGIVVLREESLKQKWMIPNRGGRMVFVDAYGNPIQFERESKDSCIIWSWGPNKKDEHGEGDDMTIRLSKGKVIKSQSADQP